MLIIACILNKYFAERFFFAVEQVFLNKEVRGMLNGKNYTALYVVFWIVYVLNCKMNGLL